MVRMASVVICVSFTLPFASRAQALEQDLPGGSAEAGDNFGSALAVGDFDCDGFSDIAIGVPGEDLGDIADAGVVNIVSGGGYQLLSENSLYQVSEADDEFGSTLAVGDFDGDDCDDLAISVSGEDALGHTNAGAVIVVEGSPDGLDPETARLWDQNQPGILSSIESGDYFGAALAAGDFDGDGRDDLAIGVPNEDGAGAVALLYGGEFGLAPAGNQLWTQDSPGVPGGSESGDSFGEALTVGDFDGDDFDDLAIGAPRETIGALDRDGCVNVLYGGESGLSSTNAQLWHEDTTGLQDQANGYGSFGHSLAAGDFDGDNLDDLAIGDPHDYLSEVRVIYGDDLGLSTARSQVWAENSPNIVAAGPFEHTLFAYTLVAGDFAGDGRDDLAVGAVGSRVGEAHAGVVVFLQGLGTGGLSYFGTRVLHEGTLNGVPQTFDVFGGALATGDFDQDNNADLVIGVPGKVLGMGSFFGYVHVVWDPLTSSPFSLGIRQ